MVLGVEANGGSGTPPAAGSGGGNSGGNGTGASGSGNAGAAGGGAGDSGVGAGSGGGTAAGAGGGGASWRDSLPSDLKDSPTLSKFSDVGNLGKAYIELQKKIGERAIFKPGPQASPEEKRAFLEAIGVPAEDKYTLGEIKDLKFPQESIDWARKVGAKAGILPEAMTEVLKEFGAFEIAQKTAADKKAKEETQKGLDGLKQEWGEGYQKNIDRANFFAKEFCGQEFFEYLGKNPALGNDPKLIKMLSKASELLGEHKLREGNVGDGRMTPSEIIQELAVVRGQLMTTPVGSGARPGLLAKLESLEKQRTGGR